jgi:3-oxoacyl-[acyl-carrier protein] reductase
MLKRVIVTGASRGIGRAIAIRLASEHFNVAINYKSQKERAQKLLDDIKQQGGQGYLLPFDISDRENTREALLNDIKANGAPWGVVCNAGIAIDSPFPILEGDMWDSVINTNLSGFYNVLKPVVMPMVEAHQGGRIVTLSSISGITGNRGQVNYSAAKAGIIGATKSLALELARRGITVNAVAPGIIETDMVKELPQKEVVRMIPMRRYGTPSEVAAVVNFLLSVESSYITGQVISVNGGMQ